VLKPDNVLVVDAYQKNLPARVVIADHGCSVFKDVQDIRYGDPRYLSPENLLGVMIQAGLRSPPTPRSVCSFEGDMWSMGAMLCNIFSSESIPFLERKCSLDKVDTLFVEELERAYDKSEEVGTTQCRGISQLALDLMKKLLRKDEKERSTAKEVLDHPWLNMASDFEPTVPLEKNLCPGSCMRLYR